jgi:hypothetical protein
MRASAVISEPPRVAADLEQRIDLAAAGDAAHLMERTRIQQRGDALACVHPPAVAEFLQRRFAAHAQGQPASALQLVQRVGGGRCGGEPVAVHRLHR